MFTATAWKNKDYRHSMTRRGKKLQNIKTPSGNYFKPSSRPRLILSFDICLIARTVFFLTRKDSTFSEGQHKMGRPPIASSGLILTRCSGPNPSKKVPFPKQGNKQHCHCIQKTIKITLCFMEVPTIKIMKFTQTSTFIKSKPNTGFHVTTCPVTFFSQEFLLLFALTTTKFMFLEVTILMLTSKKDTLTTCIKFSSIFHFKKEDLMQSRL